MSNSAARIVSAETSSHGLVDISSLVLLAILLAAGFILNMTAGNALAMTGIKPQFIIAAYALAIALTRATLAQSIVYGLISAAVIQFTTSIPGLNFLTEAAGALTMAILVKSSGASMPMPFVPMPSILSPRSDSAGSICRKKRSLAFLTVRPSTLALLVNVCPRRLLVLLWSKGRCAPLPA